jgi:hypothetical protein
MAVWGVYCRQEQERPIIVVVSATRSGADTRLEEVFRFPASDDDDRPAQLQAIARAFATKVKDNRPDAVVVRSLDKKIGKQRGDNVTRLHYQVEGVLLEVAKRHVDTVAGLSGREIGRILGVKKAEVEANAGKLIGADLKEAGGAALAALALFKDT